MPQQHTLHPHPGSHKRGRRIGRGDGSGRGSFSGRGVKGQKSRSGRKPKVGFEGGQTPLMRRIPKFRGFTNPQRKEYQVVNVGELDIFENGATVNLATLYDAGLIRRKNLSVKLLGEGELSKKLNIKVDAMSKSAKAKLEKAGCVVG